MYVDIISAFDSPRYERMRVIELILIDIEDLGITLMVMKHPNILSLELCV